MAGVRELHTSSCEVFPPSIVLYHPMCNHTQLQSAGGRPLAFCFGRPPAFCCHATSSHLYTSLKRGMFAHGRHRSS